jgi:hypothetical protein
MTPQPFAHRQAGHEGEDARAIARPEQAGERETEGREEGEERRKS